MRHVVGCDALELRKYRTEWRAVHPLVLSGRPVPDPPAPSAVVNSSLTAGGGGGAGVGIAAVAGAGAELGAAATGGSGGVKRERDGAATAADVASARERFLARRKSK